MACCGSTSRSQIVSGVAAMGISRSIVCVSIAASMFLLPFFSLGFLLQRGQPVVPESFEKLPQLLERLGVRAVEPPRAVAPFADESRFFQHGEVLRDRGTRDVEVRGDV